MAPDASGFVARTSDEVPLRVFGYARSPRVLAVMITAAYMGKDLELVDTHPSGPQAGFRDEPYASNFPFGKVPGFSHGDFYLAETSVILSYLASLDTNSGLLGKGTQQKALAEQWAAWGTSMAFPTLQPWLDPVRDHGFYEPDVIDRARKETWALFDVLDKVLSDRTYLVGDRLTIGDIMVACVVGRACKFIFDRAFRDAHPNTMRHYEFIASDPTYLELAGEITYVEEEPVPAAAIAQREGKSHKWLRA